MEGRKSSVHFLVADAQMQLTRRDVDLDLVALFDDAEGAAERRFGGHIADGKALCGQARKNLR